MFISETPTRTKILVGEQLEHRSVVSLCVNLSTLKTSKHPLPDDQKIRIGSPSLPKMKFLRCFLQHITMASLPTANVEHRWTSKPNIRFACDCHFRSMRITCLILRTAFMKEVPTVHCSHHNVIITFFQLRANAPMNFACWHGQSLQDSLGASSVGRTTSCRQRYPSASAGHPGSVSECTFPPNWRLSAIYAVNLREFFPTADSTRRITLQVMATNERRNYSCLGAGRVNSHSLHEAALFTCDHSLCYVCDNSVTFLKYSNPESARSLNAQWTKHHEIRLHKTCFQSLLLTR